MNGFSLTFGQKPINYIERNVVNNIYTDFSLDYPVSHIYIISGLRGSGKTVMLTDIKNQYKLKCDWIVIDINPNREMLEQVAAGIYENENLKKEFTKKSFGISFHGFTFSIEGDQPVSNILTVIEKMLSYVIEKKKKVLIAIDELANNAYTRSFFHDFQYLLRENYPIYCIATGLYENVCSLQNNKTLTFLYRSPKIMLPSLNLQKIEENYTKIFNNSKDSKQLAQLTKGFPFAYQVVGLLYEKYGAISLMLDEFDNYLSLYVYDKIWEELPEKEKHLLQTFNTETITTNILLLNSNLSAKEFSVYRDRLIKRGLLTSVERGSLSITLPRFIEYISKQVTY